jgi:hypothetical protein
MGEDDDGHFLNIRRLVWRTHLKDETKTHEDAEDPGFVVQQLCERSR